MTPPINSVSQERQAELREKHPLSDEALRGIADNEFGIDDPGLCAELAAELLAARRAANTPVGPELWGKYPDTGVWHQIADGTNTDEQVADFERCYAEAGWTELRRSNPFASPALPSQVVDDEDLASDERWNEGVNYAIKQLCELLGIDWRAINWDAATETLDGDVRSVIGNAMVAAYGEEWSSDAETTARIQSCLTSPAAEPVGIVVAEDDDLSVYWYEGFAVSEGDELYTHPAPSASREVTERIRAILDHPSGSPEHDLGAIRAALLAALPEREG